MPRNAGFRFKEYIEGVSVELERNPGYFVCNRVNIDSNMKMQDLWLPS